VIIEGEFSIQIKAKPSDEFRGSDRDLGTIDGCDERWGGVVESSPRKMHEIALLGIDLHSYRGKEGFGFFEYFVENDDVLME
jgi:hypothetical protein